MVELYAFANYLRFVEFSGFATRELLAIFEATAESMVKAIPEELVESEIDGNYLEDRVTITKFVLVSASSLRTI